MLDEEAQKTPMMSPEGIKIAKGEGIKKEKQPFNLIDTALEDLSINEEGATMECLSKWLHRDLQGEEQLINN